MPTVHTVEKSIELWKNFLGELYHDEPDYGAKCAVCDEDWDDSCVCVEGWTVDLFYFVCDSEEHDEELRKIILEAFEYSREVPLSGVPEFFLGSDILEGLESFLKVNGSYPKDLDIIQWMRGLSGGKRVLEPRDSLIKKTDTAPCSIIW